MKIVDLMRMVAAGVPGKVTRDHMDRVVRGYVATYASRDVDARAAFLAEDARVEDPAGNVVATSRDTALTFFHNSSQLGFAMDIRPARVITVGNEAVAVATLSISRDSRDGADVDLVIRFKFDADGLITAVTNYFDESGVTEATTGD
jgi:ketosteroid isomerase-like protein